MIVWIDAQLSPSLVPWVKESFGIEAYSIRDVGLRNAEDLQIYQSARAGGAVIMTKDSDFITLLVEHGPPPQVIWITCGNTSNTHLRKILKESFSTALELLKQGEPLVEISAGR